MITLKAIFEGHPHIPWGSDTVFPWIQETDECGKESGGVRSDQFGLDIS